MIRNGFHYSSNDDIVLTVQRCKATSRGLVAESRTAIKNKLVMGYARPVSHYNKGKQSEFRDRKWFLEPDSNSKKEAA